MSKRAKTWAKKARLRIITDLGGKCANPECGETDYDKLTFDHIHGKDWEATGKSTDQRMLRYNKEHKLNLLQCLCCSCNSKRGDPRRAEEREKFRLVIRLAARCVNGCEGVFIGDLAFVHKNPEWTISGLNEDAKLAACKQEMDAGNLVLRCPACLKSESEPF